VRRFKDSCGGRLDLREYRRVEDMREFYRFAREISSKTYQERLLQVGFPEGERAIADLEEEASHGTAYGYVLFCGERPAAYSYVRQRDRVMMGTYIGYDPEFSKRSPGTVLQYLTMERFIQSGQFDMFDHGQGEGYHKKFFATGCAWCGDVYYLRPTVKSVAVVLTHWGLDRLSSGIGSVLRSMRLKDRGKKLIRRKASEGCPTVNAKA
jgi:CelD/BcsL family acetyltransferase involved in cellulose biosynthesis